MMNLQMNRFFGKPLNEAGGVKLSIVYLGGTDAGLKLKEETNE